MSPFPLLLLLCIFINSVKNEQNGFPNSWGGCPSYPHPVPIDPKSLPNKIKIAFQQVEEGMEMLREAKGTVGLSVGVVYNQSLIWSKGFGHADKKNPKSKPTEKTIFRIGSISKVFPVIKLLMLVEEGKLHLDEEVRNIEPRFSSRNPFSESKRDITFGQLASHLAGLSRESPCLNDLCQMTNKEAYDMISEMSLIHPPGTISVYSNLGFDVLGNVLATLTNQDYHTMIKESILDPLQMPNSGVNITKILDKPKMIAKPYWEDGSECSIDQCLSDMGWSNPSGSMYSSVEDMGKLLSFFFRDETPSNREKGQLLDGSIIRDCMLIRYLNDDKVSAFALPWEVYQLGDYMIRTKEGDVDGYSGEIIMINQLKLGIIVLANVVEHASDYAQSISSILLPAFETLLNFEYSPPIPSNLKKYIGTYTYKDSGKFDGLKKASKFRIHKKHSKESHRLNKHLIHHFYNDSITQNHSGILRESIAVVASPDNNLLLLPISDDLGVLPMGKLIWLPNHLSENTFRIVQFDGDMTSCLDLQSGDAHQLVQFTSNGSEIESIKFDTFFGASFKKIK